MKTVTVARKNLLPARVAVFGAIVALLLPEIGRPMNGPTDWPAKSTGALAFYVDLCQFEGPAGKTFAEVHYAVDLSQFQVASPALAVLLIELTLVSSSGDTLANLRERRAIALSHEAAENVYSFVDVKRFELESGSVVLQLAIHDSISNQQGFVKEQFLVKKFSGALSLSDLLLSSQIEKAREQSNFEKGGLVIVPNPSRSFSARDSLQNLFVYFEINHLVYDRAKPSFYEINYRVRDAQGNEAYSNTRANIPKNPALRGARVEKIPFSKLRSGRHRLIVQVTDWAANESCQAEADFVYDSGGAEAELVLPMTEADVQKYYDQIKPIATEEEKKLYRQLSAGGKQQFLLEYWKSKDPTPGTPENEFMLEHFRRIAYCEQHFSGKLNSDMARIYVKYGPPLEVMRETSTIRINRPVEIWTYAIEGKREFVFVDRARDGHYALVHSSYAGEYNNPNWAEDFKN